MNQTSLSESLSTGQSPDGVERFEDLVAMRAAHAELVTGRRDDGETAVFHEQVAAFIRRGQATGSWLDNVADRRAAQSLLDYWDNVLQRADQPAPDPTLAEFDSTTLPDLPDERCPYLGLYAFREPNQALFFGRQRLVDTLLAHLAEWRLLSVLGPSGSGKSSAVLAGLLPALRQGALPGSADWHYLPVMVPGATPLVNLAEACQPPETDKLDWVAHQVQQFRADDGHLLKLVTGLGVATAVLIIDQFEETFTLCLDESERSAFANNLLRLVQCPDPRHTVILTLRTDFEPSIQRLPADFQAAFEPSRVRTMPMNAAELREAIEQPAHKVGLHFEEGVVDALIHDLLGEPAALPLLQFTLLRLWAKRERNRVTMDAYRVLGGGRLALANSADELYDELLPEEQVTMRRILLRMVRPGDGLEVTNNRIPRLELYRAGEAHDRVDRVLNKLVAARLVRLGVHKGYAQVEVAHEALIRNWPRLVDWLEEERVEMRRRLRLTAAAEQWEALGRDPSALRRGALLAEALGFDDLNQLEKAFVEASQAAVEAERRAELEAERREVRRLRRSAILLALFLMVAAITAVYAIIQQQAAQNNATIAEQNADMARLNEQIAQQNALLAAEQATRAFEAKGTAEADRDARATTEANANQKQEQLVLRVSEVLTAQALAEMRGEELDLALATQEALLVQLLAVTPTAVATFTPVFVSSPGGGQPTATRPGTPTPPAPPSSEQTAYAEQLETQLIEVRATQTAVARQNAGPQTLLIGASVNGVSIEAVRFGQGPNRLLFVGGMHAGTAPGTVNLAQRAIDYFTANPTAVPDTITLYIVANLNPDSVAEPGSIAGRLNANGVDLNRNWDCAWSANPAIRGERLAGAGGTAPLSEPETQALHDFVAQIEPQTIVLWFAFATNGQVVAGGCPDTRVSTMLAQVYGRAAGYNVQPTDGQIAVPGDATNWFDQQGIPAIGVLLPSYQATDWEDNLRAIQAVIAAFE